MPEASLGHISINLFREALDTTYCGTNDPVRGVVQLTWQPSAGKRTTISELFVPCEVCIVLEGVLDSKLYSKEHPWDESASSKRFETRTLFRNEINLLHDSIRLLPSSPMEFPFEMFFTPESNKTLPPSLKSSVRVGEIGGTAEIKYSLFVRMEIPGIDVSFTPEKDVQQNLKYNFEPDLRTLPGEKSNWPQHFEVSSASLRSGSDKSRRFSLFGKKYDLPIFAFSLFLTSIPLHIRVGQPLMFDLSCLLHKEASTTSEMPVIEMKSCKISLLTRTLLENCETRARPNEWKLDEEKGIPLQLHSYPRVLNAGILYNGQRYTHEVTTKPLPDMLGSFSWIDVTISHRLRIEMAVIVAKKTVKLDQCIDIQIYPKIPRRFQTAITDGEKVVSTSEEVRSDTFPVYSMSDIEVLNARAGGGYEYDTSILNYITARGRRKQNEKLQASLERRDRILARGLSTENSSQISKTGPEHSDQEQETQCMKL